MNMLISPVSYVKEWYYWVKELATDPNAVYTLFLLILQTAFVVFTALSVPIFVRYATLPSSIYEEVPLNLVFKPCTEDLHGICSFPTADLDLREKNIFSPGIYYSINVRLEFMAVEANVKMGLFQNRLVIFDSSGSKIKDWYRTSYVREPGLLTRALWIIFFPLYVLGFFDDYSVLEIPLASDYFSSPQNPGFRLEYSLQDRYAQIHSARLLVHAKFGLFRYFLYYWPMASYVVIFLVAFFVCSVPLSVYWGGVTYNKYKRERSPIEKDKLKKYEKNPQECFVDQTKTPETHRGLITDSIKKTHAPPPASSDEYIPDNVDELPECSSLIGIPELTKFSSSTSQSRGLRRRK